MLDLPNAPSCHVHPMSLDSGATPAAFLKRELELGTGAFVCTDHGSLGAAKDVYDLAKANKLIPIIGVEGYFRDENCPILIQNGYEKNSMGGFIKAPKYSHITMHAMDQDAYKCLVRLISAADARLEAHLEMLEPEHRKHGHERKPLFNWADLEELGSHNI
ncbi:MAG TPA: PHP domain-containing protein, partial [Legionellaceae bacterium]|nr:PHP domain-containing protein [Legionellaceae bacterium]